MNTIDIKKIQKTFIELEEIKQRLKKKLQKNIKTTNEKQS